MMNEIIDVDFKDITESNDTESNGIVINATPETALISEFASMVKTFSNDLRKYKVVQEQEKTQRAAIKANMKIAIAEINSKKEVLLQRLDDIHQNHMAYYQTYNTMLMKSLDAYIDSISDARKIAQSEKDFTAVIALLKELNEFTELRSRYLLEFVDKTNVPLLNSNIPKKYLE